ncbi:TIGR02757 family protein [Lutibacter agarilyticus]|uniref:TIGR02757 family protein n=1 Tax=Lutibacter agarilyticus TaxID=1109740 RepID=A0A238VE22_9FLAO|nr:TIGR02757 family protein [Lutibacter agarilyticus]
MKKSELKVFLDEKVLEYNNLTFIESDPIQIPHLYSQKEDIEIAGFLAATIAWGNRKMIIKNAHKMMELMGNSPYDFVMSHKGHDLEKMEGFVHRTFNSIDFSYFITALNHIYTNHQGLEQIFNLNATNNSLQPAIHQLKKIFFEIHHPQRTMKHISDPLKGSAAKRINILIRIIKMAN